MRPSRPLEVAVADLRRRPGTRRDLRVDVVLQGLGTSTATVPDGAPIELDLALESLSNQLAVTGRVSAPWAGECRRCLSPVEGRTDSSVQEVFDPHPVEGETYLLGDDLIDLEPLVRDAVLLALPLAPLCGPGCTGPAPETFPTGVEPVEDSADVLGRGEGNGRPRDPRWAALDDLRFEES